MIGARTTRGSARPVAVAVSALMLAAGGTGFWFFNGRKPAEPGRSDAARVPVRRGTLKIILTRTATFEAEEARRIKAEIHGSARIVSLVEEGAQVKKNDVLMELDKTDIQKEIEQREANMERADANLKAAQLDKVIIELECKSQIEKAQMNVTTTQQEIEKFTSGVKRKEERDAEIKIEEAKVRLSQAEEVYKRMPAMLEQGFVTKEEVKQNKLAVDTARNALGTAQLEQTILRDYTHPMRLSKLQQDHAWAKEELKRHEKVKLRRAEHITAVLRQREQESKRAERRLADVKERLGKMTIRAPGNGIVVYGGGYRWGWLRQREDIRVGGAVWRDQVVMRLPDLNTMQLAVNIHEADFNKIHVDKKNRQPVAITVDSMPGKTFKGWVKKIATLAHTERGRDHVKLFSTTVALDEQIKGMRPGMTANVEIFVDELEDVLHVPVQAVHARHGEIFCYVVAADGSQEKRPVDIGASNDSFVEIKDGLTEAEEVLIVQPEVEAGGASKKKARSPEAPYGRRRKRTR